LSRRGYRRIKATQREATKRVSLRCIFGHKWGAADRAEDGAQTLVCRRCGKTRALAGSTLAGRHNEEAGKAPTRMDVP